MIYIQTDISPTQLHTYELISIKFLKWACFFFFFCIFLLFFFLSLFCRMIEKATLALGENNIPVHFILTKHWNINTNPSALRALWHENPNETQRLYVPKYLNSLICLCKLPADPGIFLNRTNAHESFEGRLLWEIWINQSTIWIPSKLSFWKKK